MSTLLRQTWLKAMRLLGVPCFRARSGLGYNFVCHVGDEAGEGPFYNSSHSRAEIAVMAAYCDLHRESVVFDVGANLGFISTQLAQATADKPCRIIAIEPVWSTFHKLQQSVEKLKLSSRIFPLCCALSDWEGVCSIRYNLHASLFAQIDHNGSNHRAGSTVQWCSVLTLDAIAQALGAIPTLIKIDVEGFECHVLRGAKAVLASPDPPALCFELNPLTLSEVGVSVESLEAERRDYRLFYIDCFDSHKLPFGHELTDLSSIPWVCNIFALPRGVSDEIVNRVFAGNPTLS